MKRTIVGEIDLQGSVDITDPCYQKEDWCRMNDVKVSPGLYTCIAWRQKEKESRDYKVVGILGIYLGGAIPSQKSMERIGTIGVDSGLAGFFPDKPDFSDEEWSAFCDKLWKNNADVWLDGYGFYSSSGYGDGGYDVYAFRADGEITALEIRFL